MLDRITGTLQFQGQALELRAQRQQVLASNIANVDTPNYQARDFAFGAALARATANLPSARPSAVPLPGMAAGPLALVPADGGAAPARAFLPVGAAAASGAPALSWRTPEQPSLDGNTVDLDRERANFADNALRYEATLRFINGNVRNVLSAIRGD